MYFLKGAIIDNSRNIYVTHTGESRVWPAGIERFLCYWTRELLSYAYKLDKNEVTIYALISFSHISGAPHNVYRPCISTTKMGSSCISVAQIPTGYIAVFEVLAHGFQPNTASQFIEMS